MRSILDISDSLPTVKNTIQKRFIPVITGGPVSNEEERKLLSLPIRYRD